MTALCLVALFATQLAADIDGKLIHSVTKKPIPRASVQVIDAADGRRIADATADAEGAFHFAGLPAGRVRVTSQHPRFVRYEFHGVLDLAADTILTNLTLKLTPSSAITGRVTDADGDPIENAVVQIYRASHFGKEERWMPFGGGRSDDRGVYRISGVQPGRYLVSAQKEESPYRMTFYPNTGYAAEARAIRVRVGEDVDNLNFVLPAKKTGVIRGVFPGEDRAWIVVEVPASENRIPFQQNQQISLNRETRAFEIRGLLPGRHAIKVMGGGPGLPPKILATAEVEFAGQDIEGLTFEPATFGTLTGKIVYEGENRTPRRIQLIHDRFASGNYQSPAKPSGDGGAFELENILPRRYAVRVDLGEQQAYVKSLRQGDREIPDRNIEVRAGANEPLTVVVSSKVSTLRGTVERVDPSAPPGVVVLEPLQPSLEPEMLSGQRPPQVNQYGAYEVSKLAPGKYRVFAFEAVQFGDAYNRALLKRLAAHATEITLGEGESRELNLKQITAAQVEEALEATQSP
jgi:hypothetical protein